MADPERIKKTTTEIGYLDPGSQTVEIQTVNLRSRRTTGTIVVSYEEYFRREDNTPKVGVATEKTGE